MSALQRNNVVEHGPRDGQPMLFAHGFGCDQNMWRFVWPAFADDYRIVLFDHVGAGGSDRRPTTATGTARSRATPTTCSRSAVSST